MARALQRHRAESELPDRIVVAVANDYEHDVFTRLLTEGDGGS